MNESFTPKMTEAPELNTEKSQEEIYRKCYENKPPAEPKMFHRNAEGEVESPLKFPPIPIRVSEETLAEIKESGIYTAVDFEYRGLAKRFKKLEGGNDINSECMVSCCMRAEGDNNRIDTMIASIAQGDWEPARIEHLLILSWTNPDLFNDPIVALGSEIKRSGNVPCVQLVNGKLEYHEHSRHCGFNKNFSFLIVQK